MALTCADMARYLVTRAVARPATARMIHIASTTLSLEAQPDEEGRHRVEVSDGDADVIEVPDRRHGVHPPVLVRQVRFSIDALVRGDRPFMAGARSRVSFRDLTEGIRQTTTVTA